MEMEDGTRTILDAFQPSVELEFFKTFLPFFPPNQQRELAVLIKFLELQQLLDFIRRPQCTCRQQEMTPMHVMEAMRSSMPQENAEQLDMILSMMSLMESGGMDAGDLMQSMMDKFDT